MSIRHPKTAETMTAAAGTRTRPSRETQAALSEAKADYTDPETAKQYLVKYNLLVPDGAELTTSTMATCMHQIASLAGVSKKAELAMRSLATLLEIMAEDGLKETVREVIIGELNSMVEDINGALSEVKNTLQEEVTKHATALKEAVTDRVNHAPTQGQQPDTQQATPYKDALACPPPTADPKIAAKEGIRARQFLLDLRADCPMRGLSQQEVLKLVNKATVSAGASGKQTKIRMVERLTNKGILGEFMHDEGAKWFRNPNNTDDFLEALGTDGRGASVRARMFSVIVFFCPLMFDTEDTDELVETNSFLQREDIKRVRWVKNPERRAWGQRFAHLMISFTHQDAANEAILRGLVVCRKKVSVAKSRKEPTRCLKCQGWNHIAAECRETEDTCAGCGTKGHRVTECENQHALHCTPCGISGHTASDRLCPTFLKRCREFDERHPENAIPFFPSAQPWTWHHESPNLPPLTLIQHSEATPSTGSSNQTQRYRQQALTEFMGGTAQSSMAQSNVYKRNTGLQGKTFSTSTENQQVATDKPPFPHPESREAPPIDV